MPILNFIRRPQNELEAGGRSRVRSDHSDPETTCPNCEEEIFFDETILEDGCVECPNCGEKLEFDLDDEVEEESDEEE